MHELSQVHAQSAHVKCKVRSLDGRRRTLSKPAMFLFSAKNSAGLFCDSFVALDFDMAFGVHWTQPGLLSNRRALHYFS